MCWTGERNWVEKEKENANLEVKAIRKNGEKASRGKVQVENKKRGVSFYPFSLRLAAVDRTAAAPRKTTAVGSLFSLFNLVCSVLVQLQISPHFEIYVYVWSLNFSIRIGHID